MRTNRLIESLLLCIVSFSLGVSALAQQKRWPNFTDYPVITRYGDKPAPVNISSHPLAKVFRTKLREGAKKGPNFAGHYTVVTWGCSTDCESVAIVDARNGKVFFPPFATVFGVDFRLDSNLFINEPASKIPKDYNPMFTSPLGVKTQYYIWRNNRFTPINSGKGKDAIKRSK